MMTTIKEQTKELWLSTFDDTVEFVDFYFDEIYADKINYTIQDNGRVISALQTIPFDFKVGNKLLKTAYLSGVCTDKLHRNCGFMGKLMRHTHDDLFDKGIDAIFLIPAEPYLFDVYAKYGYKTAFYKAYSSISVDMLQVKDYSLKISELDTSSFDLAYSYLYKKQLQQPSGIIFGERYFHSVIKAFLLEKNKIFVVEKANEIVGISFVTLTGKLLLLFAENDDIRQTFLRHIADSIGQNTLSIKSNIKGERYGMMLFNTTNHLVPTDNPFVTLLLDE
ncbi:MAG: hypothetical protein CSA89_00015 [Bacteroidales bacterium]|nr:MAG: hypothetical protein CSA89_00015 [Bacteroidales bacterium]